MWCFFLQESRYSNVFLYSRNKILKIRVGPIMSNEPPHDKTNKMVCAPSEDSDQPGHPPSLIRVFAVRMKKAWVLSYPLSAQRRLWSDWADVQADLNLRWAHTHFVGFVTKRLKYVLTHSCLASHFLAPRQTVQTVKSRRTRRLIRVSTVCLQQFLLQLKKKMKKHSRHPSNWIWTWKGWESPLGKKG